MFNIFSDRAESITSWKPEPQYRGTYSILSTCILTLVLCVWTVVHLNLPAYGEKQWRQLFRKVGWLVVGLLAPEMVAFTAFQKWRDARSLTKEMTSYFLRRQTQPLPSWVRVARKILVLCGFRSRGYFKEETPDDTHHTWTIVHSFYAVMGGFAIQPTDISTNFFVRNQVRMTVTPGAISFIAKMEPDLIPDISRKEIQDKSKANALAKTIVLFQASWFACQCITRLVQHLSISLLELNTFGHCICALLIAFLWWHKPLDVGESSLLKNSVNQELLALLYMSSRCDGNGPEATSEDAINPPCNRAENRWRLASLALNNGSYNLRKEAVEDRFNDWTIEMYLPHGTVVKRVRNFPRLGYQKDDRPFYTGLSFAALIYAGLHLVAWENTFPSRAEQILWRLSCLTVASTGIFLALVFGYEYFQRESAGPQRYRFGEKRTHALMSWLILQDLVSLFTYPLRKISWYIFPPVFRYLKWPFLISYGALYLLARIFLVVESFIDLAHLPDSAFELPRWSRYFPHIG